MQYTQTQTQACTQRHTHKHTHTYKHKHTDVLTVASWEITKWGDTWSMLGERDEWDQGHRSVNNPIHPFNTTYTHAYTL